MDLDVAGHMAGSGQEAGIVPARRLELGGHGRHVHILPDLDGRPDGEPIPLQRQAHRRLKGPEMRVEVLPLVADHDQLSRLISRDEERGAQTSQQGRKVGCVHRTK